MKFQNFFVDKKYIVACNQNYTLNSTENDNFLLQVPTGFFKKLICLHMLNPGSHLEPQHLCSIFSSFEIVIYQFFIVVVIVVFVVVVVINFSHIDLLNFNQTLG